MEGTALTDTRHGTTQEDVVRSSTPRWPWWLVGRSTKQVLTGMIGPTVSAVVILLRLNNTPYPSLLRWAFLLMIIVTLGCAVASILALRRNTNLKNATHQRRPIAPTTRHLYAVATLVGVAVLVIVLVVALVVQTLFAWIALAATAALTLLFFAQLGRPLPDLQAASTSNA